MPELTPRQLQILRLVVLSNREIAARLGISHRTVNNHLNDMYDRLNIDGDASVGKRTLALLAALQAGVVTLDEIEPPPQRLPTGWDRERFAQAHMAQWREWRKSDVLALVAQMD